MRLAVAATKTRALFSCIHVRKPEKMRDIEASPPSRYPPTPISISSIQSTAGETASTERSARRNVASGLGVPKTAFMSRRKSGRFQSVEIVLTAEALAAAGDSHQEQPRGIGMPASSASLEKSAWRFWSHVFSVS